MATRCQFKGASGTHLDKNGWCLEPAERKTDARALGQPDEALDLCQEHHEFVKAYFLEQSKRAG
jgi:hypothetical protein